MAGRRTTPAPGQTPQVKQATHGSCRDGPTAASAHRPLLANTNPRSIAPSGVRTGRRQACRAVSSAFLQRPRPAAGSTHLAAWPDSAADGSTPRLPSYGPAESRCRSGPAAGTSWDRGVAMPYKPGPVAPGPAGQLRRADADEVPPRGAGRRVPVARDHRPAVAGEFVAWFGRRRSASGWAPGEPLAGASLAIVGGTWRVPGRGGVRSPCRKRFLRPDPVLY